jgi:hypothetical protein
MMYDLGVACLLVLYEGEQLPIELLGQGLGQSQGFSQLAAIYSI